MINIDSIFNLNKKQTNMQTKQLIFYISDGTGITAETIGHTLMSQFNQDNLESLTIPYIDTEEKAIKIVEKINLASANSEKKPLILATIINDDIRKIIKNSDGYMLEFFDIFLKPIANVLQQPYEHVAGRSHGIFDKKNYKNRLNAVNLSLTCDDGMAMKHYKDVDLIILGPSRTGKTPTCLYLSLHFGIAAANYPLISDDLEKIAAPSFIHEFKNKLFGIIVDPKRLHLMREERNIDAKYASETQCIWEINRIKKIYKQFNIPFMDVTNHSIEEIATKALEQLNISRKLI